jgi:hypothetical protein
MSMYMEIDSKDFDELVSIIRSSIDAVFAYGNKPLSDSWKLRLERVLGHVVLDERDLGGDNILG